MTLTQKRNATYFSAIALIAIGMLFRLNGQPEIYWGFVAAGLVAVGFNLYYRARAKRERKQLLSELEHSLRK